MSEAPPKTGPYSAAALVFLRLTLQGVDPTDPRVRLLATLDAQAERIYDGAHALGFREGYQRGRRDAEAEILGLAKAASEMIEGGQSQGMTREQIARSLLEKMKGQG